ncbi:S-adenosylmethionine:tRNA ribosyltransferase-isomerase (plasmid) [Rhizobium leguminosarum]|uniref:S-adenosylmethionine:tRNA ribosyltransferase-isomerase n=1 Tax=Rhizobium leguminosarum TaxID=384 RepID=UPI001031D900|nr:S-adenosylmethionine:tRNA ribosyltransferase-isomerase [Rhizobium leguminosarum]TAX46674.1 S-adenosylmethionine:tRNA ribosyltransferase-isomerase [Rhizobium leguminosarum]
MLLDRLKYDLSPENIACEPREVRLGSRDRGRMLVVRRSEGLLEDSQVLALPEFLKAGDVLIINDSKRLPGVLKTHTREGAQIEFRLTEFSSDQTCLARPYPTHFVTPNLRVTTDTGSVLTVIETNVGPHRLCVLKSNDDLVEVLKVDGLPITSFFYKSYWNIDHYNPIYASEEGSVESPMAGLHFTEKLIAELRTKGIHVCPVTLHVVGSWLPFLEDDVDSHIAQAEWYHIPQETAERIAEARVAGARIVAVGSTSMRAIESAALVSGVVPAGSGVSTLYLKPGAEFRAVCGYFTNFHPARSSLMVLDAAFTPVDLLMRAYHHAQRRGYLFQEFGDAILYL